MSEMINVEVAYATPEKQLILTVAVPVGTSMFEVAERSDIVKAFPEIDLSTAPMGIFGKAEKKPKKRVVASGERVEIYRPLLIDPKEVRKKRAAKVAAAKAQAKKQT